MKCSLGFRGCCKGRQPKSKPPLSHPPNHLPALATSPKTLTTLCNYLKLRLIACFHVFSFWRKLQHYSKINHRVAVSQKNANLSRFEMLLISFYTWKGKFYPRGQKLPPLDENTLKRKTLNFKKLQKSGLKLSQLGAIYKLHRHLGGGGVSRLSISGRGYLDGVLLQKS